LSDDYTSALSRNQSPNSQFTEGVLHGKAAQLGWQQWYYEESTSS